MEQYFLFEVLLPTLQNRPLVFYSSNEKIKRFNNFAKEINKLINLIFLKKNLTRNEIKIYEKKLKKYMSII